MAAVTRFSVVSGVSGAAMDREQAGASRPFRQQHRGLYRQRQQHRASYRRTAKQNRPYNQSIKIRYTTARESTALATRPLAWSRVVQLTLVPAEDLDPGG